MPEIPAPSTDSVDFACPHCGAHATQYWHTVRADHTKARDNSPSLPLVPDPDFIAQFEATVAKISDPDKRAAQMKVLKSLRRMLDGMPFLQAEDNYHTTYTVLNLSISECHTCKQLGIWVYDKLIYPPTRTGPKPNADLPTDILRDYEEASAILALSPRGAAALLRLAIQKLCIHVGAKGDDISAMIGWLVQNGLSEKIKQALDAVRVIGNEAVHPGQLDLRDDGATASELFELVNIISDVMISQRIQKLYDKIPATKKAAIEQRDAKAKSPNATKGS